MIVIATLLYLRPSVAQPSPHSRLQTPPIQPKYIVLPISSTTVYVFVGLRSASPPSLYVTLDTGRVWRRLSVPSPKSEEVVGAYSLADGKLVVQSWNVSSPQQTHAYVGDGETWMEVKLPLQALPIDLANGGWPRMLDSRVGFYFASGQSLNNEHALTIFRTQDAGSHWDLMLQLDAAHPDAGGLSIAEDHGVSFTDATHGWLVSTAQPYTQVCGTSGWTPAGRFMASDDGGRNWTERQLQPLPNGSAQLGPVTMHGLAGYMPAVVQIYTGTCPPENVTFTYSTTDGGMTWSPAKWLPSDFFSTDDGIDWWATDREHLLRSRDQGASWSTKLARLPARGVMLGDLYPVGGDAAWSLWVPAPDPITFRIPTTGRIALLRTTDGGATWSEVKLPPVPS